MTTETVDRDVLSLREVVKDFDENFDYRNLTQLRDPFFLKKKYGDELVKRFTDCFEKTWFHILGTAIYENDAIHNLMAEVLRTILKSSNTDYKDDDLSDYVSTTDSVFESVNSVWNAGNDSYHVLTNNELKALLTANEEVKYTIRFPNEEVK